MNYLKNGVNILFEKINNYFIYFIKKILNRIQNDLRVLTRSDKLREYLNIDEKNLTQIQEIIFYLKMYIKIKPNLKWFFICIIVYGFCWLYILSNFIIVFILPSNFIYAFCFQSIVLLLCLILYYGSDEFFDVISIGENLVIFLIFILIILSSLFIPKKYLLSLFFNISLIAINIFLLINLNFN